MAMQVSAVMIGVQDLQRAKTFYGDGLGCKLDKDFPTFVSFDLGEGSSELALYGWGAAAEDAGVPPDGSGFRGVSFHYLVASQDDVDDVLAKATEAGGTLAKAGHAAPWGGYFGYFSDPDGHLWKVAAR